ncbi:pentatricopeptide repeat-containing protein, chloroplastic [Nicotiana attenuata]|uniref:Pentatricopeptide repeat-containing protein, chloroplastic n=1 Tax=Nicotiana attenuata TaxID=49451 RepID=A0A1J6J3U7_NICAT|nr:pentatricopeptide repeat-containing protein, chloroplastic [Nicotiana attenuata]
MASTALLSIPPPQLNSATKSKVQRKTSVYCSLDCSTSATTTSTVNDQDTPKKFTYSRASPSARWPHLKFTDTHQNSHLSQLSIPVTSIKNVEFDFESDVKEESLNSNDENQEVLGRTSRTEAKKMTKLALKRAKDWRKRVQFLTDKILELKVVKKAEGVVATLEERYGVVERTAWNALIQAYALSGFYEKARAIFNTMMRNGPSPTLDTINNLMQVLIVDSSLNELYVLIQELQDMVFKISKSSILLMLEALAQAGDIFEVKKIYNGMRVAGYLPTMHLYILIIRYVKAIPPFFWHDPYDANETSKCTTSINYSIRRNARDVYILILQCVILFYHLFMGLKNT